MPTKFVNSNNLETLARGLYDRVDTRLDGKSFKYLTLAEYEALSDAEKNDDSIIYQITDAELSYNDLVDTPDLSIYARKSDVPNITILTQAEYDAIEGTDQEDPDTFYLISDEL